MKKKSFYSDIAEIQSWNHRDYIWETIAYIGPDRSGGEVGIDYFVGYPPRIRVIYYDMNEK